MPDPKSYEVHMTAVHEASQSHRKVFGNIFRP